MRFGRGAGGPVPRVPSFKGGPVQISLLPSVADLFLFIKQRQRVLSFNLGKGFASLTAAAQSPRSGVSSGSPGETNSKQQQQQQQVLRLLLQT